MSYYIQDINEAYKLLKDESTLYWDIYAFRIGPDYNSILIYNTISKRGSNVTEEYFKEMFFGVTFENKE